MNRTKFKVAPAEYEGGSAQDLRKSMATGKFADDDRRLIKVNQTKA